MINEPVTRDIQTVFPLHPVCLDVFQEQGLLQMEQRPKLLVIHLTSDGKKVDLEQSPTLQHLKERLKAGI